MHWTSIQERTIGDVVVLQLEGQVTLGGEEKRLRHAVEALMTAQPLKVVLDLARVPHIDSVGVGEIVRAYSAVVRAGGSLRLIGAGRRVSEVLEATQLAPILRVCDTVEEAIASFDA